MTILVSHLSSTDSATGSGPVLFVSFSGTMELPDSPVTCMSAVRHRASADRSSAMEAVDVTGVSRLPRERFSSVRVVSDSVGDTTRSP